LLKRKTENEKPAESVNDSRERERGVRESGRAQERKSAIRWECVGEQSTNTNKSQSAAENVRVKQNIQLRRKASRMEDLQESARAAERSSAWVFVRAKSRLRLCWWNFPSRNALSLSCISATTLSLSNLVSLRYLPKASCRYR